MRFVLYARASTRDKQNPDHQLAELRAWAASKGHGVAYEIIERESGRKDDRPEWQRALETVLTGKADGIASVELSRFGRSTRHLLEVAQAIEHAGGHLVCTRQPIDTTSPVGRLVFTLLAAVATFEAELTAERVRAGVAYARGKRGGSWGRPREVVAPEAIRIALDQRIGPSKLSWRTISAMLADLGHVQPARYADGREVRKPRPWPIGTLRDAVARVEKPTSQTG